MLVRFWGTRGSLPTPLNASLIQNKIVDAVMAAGGRVFETRDDAASFVQNDLSFAQRGTYGGESSCVEIESGSDEYILCDMGSGLRRFGLNSLQQSASGKSKTFNFFMSHVHWDHIMGFPFFVPAFDPNATINIFGGHDDLERALRRQQEKISFPVPFDALNATFNFTTLNRARPMTSPAAASRSSVSSMTMIRSVTGSKPATGPWCTVPIPNISRNTWRMNEPSFPSSRMPTS